VRYASIAASTEPCFVTSSLAIASLRSGNMPAKRLTCSASLPPPAPDDAPPEPPPDALMEPAGNAHRLSMYLAWMKLRMAGSSDSGDTAMSLPFQRAHSSSRSRVLPPEQILSASATDQEVMLTPLTVRPTSRRNPPQRWQTKLQCCISTFVTCPPHTAQRLLALSFFLKASMRAVGSLDTTIAREHVRLKAGT